MTDNNNSDLETRVEQLEQRLNKREEVLKRLASALPDTKRRQVLAAAGIGGLAALSSPAAAAGESWGSSTGTIGTDSEPLGVGNIDDLDVQDLTVANSLSTTDLSATNALVWQKDGELTVSAGTSGTYTLTKAYDAVMVVVKNFDGGDNLDLRVNGDTGTNYNHLDFTGTATTGATEIGLAVSRKNGRGQILTMSGRWPVDFSIDCGTREGNDNSFTRTGENTSVTSPLDSITLIARGGSAFSITAAVYGLD